MDLSSFIKESVGPIIVSEGIRSRDIEKAIKLISQYLNKRKIYTIPVIHQMSIDGKNKLGIYSFNEKNEGCLFVWELAASYQIESVLFTKDFESAYASVHYPEQSKFVYDVYVESKGANIMQMCKLVESVLTGKVQMNVNAIRAQIKDAQLFESVEGVNINESDDPHIAELVKKRDTLYRKIRNMKKTGKDAKEIEDLQQQYDELAKELSDARLSIKQNVQVVSTTDKEVENLQNYFEEEERATPEERFEDMHYYVTSVILGRRNFAVLCGAPGVGKSYRVLQNIKSAGKEQGVDWKLLKGKSTAAALYQTLHDFKEPGQIIVFDDCDSVFKDPDAINLLKAAYDSSDERWVTWGTTSPIPMSTEMAEQCDDAVYDEHKNKWYYPKEFLYEGGGILITNFSAGQIDTAIRNRALICDLSFTTEEVLDLIEGLMPKIDPGVYSDQAKQRALEYLRDLAAKGAPVELSIRSFTTCAGIYMADAPEKTIQRMIREQMRNQFMKGGKKY